MYWYQDGKLYEQIPVENTKNAENKPQSANTPSMKAWNKLVEIADAEVMFWVVIAILLYALKPDYLLLYVVVSAVLLVLLS
jgi:hypothetical protein